jgi:hypothetical protein
MTHVPRLAVGLVASSAIALAGCGSSSSLLSKAQLATKADAVCSAYTKAATAVPQPKDFLTNPVSAAAYLDKLTPLAATQEKAMLALKPDSGAKALWDRFVAAGEHTTSLLNEADAKAHAKQSTVNPLATQLGATDCAR